ncbi:hypothetical protein L249_1916 [Ophiocordyceps polyrhachis-furcata BCC 54312]|uniref:Uncharacterized protein n=1 Tax=Ophiocordyceps polyrhachis-furcata BCC 54312 TaxID=1330021 RepID=A0A367LR51_9HYPO|nr:hypothetical protein L249_1916 [Ophiocordyceps polyrhachis-furcata BCC 54312]
MSVWVHTLIFTTMAGLQAPITLIGSWVFPPGAVTDIYYIRMKHLPYGIDADQLLSHVAKAWHAKDTKQVCVFKQHSTGWVQVLGHDDFRTLFSCVSNCSVPDLGRKTHGHYLLADDGRRMGDKDVRIHSINESTDILLPIPEDDTPHSHFAMYSSAEMLMQASCTVSPYVARSVRHFPATSCDHEYDNDEVIICNDCLAELEERRWQLFAATDGGDDHDGRKLCRRHERRECKLCNRPRGYGRRENGMRYLRARANENIAVHTYVFLLGRYHGHWTNRTQPPPFSPARRRWRERVMFLETGGEYTMLPSPDRQIIDPCPRDKKLSVGLQKGGKGWFVSMARACFGGRRVTCSMGLTNIMKIRWDGWIGVRERTARGRGGEEGDSIISIISSIIISIIINSIIISIIISIVSIINRRQHLRAEQSRAE